MQRLPRRLQRVQFRQWTLLLHSGSCKRPKALDARRSAATLYKYTQTARRLTKDAGLPQKGRRQKNVARGAKYAKTRATFTPPEMRGAGREDFDALWNDDMRFCKSSGTGRQAVGFLPGHNNTLLTGGLADAACQPLSSPSVWFLYLP